MAISWRNIDAPSFGAANLLSTSAGNRISDGISQLQSLAEQQGRNAQAERDQLKTDNTDSVLNDIYALDSMEAYNSAMDSDQFSADTLTGMYGKDIDLNRIRSALMQQDNTIMEDETTAYNYQQTLQSRQDSPILDDIATKSLQANSVQDIDALLDSLADSGLSVAGQNAAAKTLTTQKQSLLDQAYQQVVRGRESQEFSRKVKSWAEQDEQKAIAEQLKFSDTYNDFVLQETTANEKLATLDSKYYTPEHMDEVMVQGTPEDAIREYMPNFDSKEVAIEDVQADLNSFFQGSTTIPYITMDENGKKVTNEIAVGSLPKWVVKQALQSLDMTNVGPDFWSWDFGGRDLPSGFKETLKNQAAKYMQEFEMVRQQSRDKANELTVIRNDITNAEVNKRQLEHQLLQSYRKAKQKKPVSL